MTWLGFAAVLVGFWGLGTIGFMAVQYRRRYLFVKRQAELARWHTLEVRRRQANGQFSVEEVELDVDDSASVQHFVSVMSPDTRLDDITVIRSRKRPKEFSDQLVGT